MGILDNITDTAEDIGEDFAEEPLNTGARATTAPIRFFSREGQELYFGSEEKFADAVGDAYQTTGQAIDEAVSGSSVDPLINDTTSDWIIQEPTKSVSKTILGVNPEKGTVENPDAWDVAETGLLASGLAGKGVSTALRSGAKTYAGFNIAEEGYQQGKQFVSNENNKTTTGKTDSKQRMSNNPSSNNLTNSVKGFDMRILALVGLAILLILSSR